MVQIFVRTTDDLGQYSYDFVGYRETATLIAKGKVTIYVSSEPQECVAKASSSILGCIPFGRRVALKAAMKKIREGKGEDLDWFEKIEFYMKESPSAWPKSGLRI